MSFGFDPFTFGQPQPQQPLGGMTDGFGFDLNRLLGSPVAQQPIAQIPEATMDTTYANPPSQLGPFGLWGLNSADIAQANQQGGAAFGNQLLKGAFSGTWGGIGTALASASQARQAIQQKSLEDASKRAMDVSNFLTKQDADQLDKTFTQEKLKAFVTDQSQNQDERAALKSFLTDNSTVSGLLKQYEDAAVAEPDKDKAADMIRKLTVAKANIGILSASPDQKSVGSVMNILDGLNKDLGEDTDFAEKLSKQSRLEAAAAGFTGPTAVADFAKSKAMKNADDHAQAMALIALRNEKTAAPQGNSSEQGMTPTSAANKVLAIQNKINDGIQHIFDSRTAPSAKVALLNSMGINATADDIDDENMPSPAIQAKLLEMQKNAQSLAATQVQSAAAAIGSHIKGSGVATSTQIASPAPGVVEKTTTKFVVPKAEDFPGFAKLPLDYQRMLQVALSHASSPAEVSMIEEKMKRLAGGS